MQPTIYNSQVATPMDANYQPPITHMKQHNKYDIQRLIYATSINHKTLCWCGGEITIGIVCGVSWVTTSILITGYYVYGFVLYGARLAIVGG